MSKYKKQNKIKPKNRKVQNSFQIGKKMIGILDVSRHGKGYVVVDGLDQDILIYPENMGSSLDGDRVKCEIDKVGKKGKLEGHITDIIAHSRTSFIGRLEVSSNFAFLISDDKHVHTDIFVPIQHLKGAKNGEKVLVQIVEWQGKNKKPIGKVVEILTNERINAIAMKEILIANGFSLRFSEEAQLEVEKLPDEISSEIISERKDIREITTFTIDPKEAKDFDDALSVRVLKNGLIEVGVHIADVSYYVNPETNLDAEAYERATSVYLPDRVCPMLPEHISNFLCSLRPDEDKLAFSVIFQLNREGEVNQYWIGKTVIHSDNRLTYEDAQQAIVTGMGQCVEEIQLLNEIAQNLRKERISKGAINFSSEEVRFILDNEGIPIGMEIKESGEANQLIEEFMLLANRTVAAFVNKKKVKDKPIPFPYRVHDQPDEAKLATFSAFVSRLGYKINLNSPEAVAKSFNEMLLKAKGKPESKLLEQLGIRTMAKAVYSTESIGHYGLGFEYYCHFTSPIRRYPDVMVHRILQEIIEKKIQTDSEMERKCYHCSERERKAMKAEREANKYKQVEYMEKYIGETLDAVITGISPHGFWAATLLQKCEGMVSLSDLLDWDTFEYIEENYSLRGNHTNLRFQMGDKVKIRVVATNLEKRQVDFEWVSEDKMRSKKK